MKELELRRSVRALAATVTGRRRMETPEVLQSILDKAPALIYLKDTRGRHLMVIAAFEQTFDMKAEQVIGHRAVDVLPADQVASLDQADAEVIERLQSVQPSVTLQTVSGQLHHHSAASFPLLDWTGTPSNGRTSTTCASFPSTTR